MKNTGQIKPWHIVVFVLAIVLVAWQVFSYQREKQRLHGEYRLPPGVGNSPQTQPLLGKMGERIQREQQMQQPGRR